MIRETRNQESLNSRDAHRGQKSPTTPVASIVATYACQRSCRSIQALPHWSHQMGVDCCDVTVLAADPGVRLDNVSLPQRG